VVLGDARLKLERAPDRRYGLIVADAFSSDAIPVHLLTREALELYRSKLQPRGIVAFNVSNIYVALEPVLGNLAHEAGLACVAQADRQSGADGIAETDASDWVLITSERRDLGPVALDRRWHDCRRERASAVWTDDFSNLLGALDLSN
jgi:spermidine synthase